jgi:Spy/CpxP family protein refolding chaperone
MMKTVLATAAMAAALAFNAAAQTPAPAKSAAPAPAPSAVDETRKAAASDKRGLVEKNMQLTPEEAKKFWPIYDEYQKELDKIVQKQNRAVLDYVNGESSMTDANAKRIARDVLAADGEEQKLRERTAKKMLGALPAKKAVRFLQIENKLRTLNRYDIAERIPLVK